jgi:hypothetical protein
MKLPKDELIDLRYRKFRAMGQILEAAHESR